MENIQHTGIEMARMYKAILEHTKSLPPEDYEKQMTRMGILTMLIDRLRRAQNRGETCPVYGKTILISCFASD